MKIIVMDDHEEEVIEKVIVSSKEGRSIITILRSMSGEIIDWCFPLECEDSLKVWKYMDRYILFKEKINNIQNLYDLINKKVGDNE